jgi:hypothetical protein
LPFLSYRLYCPMTFWLTPMLYRSTDVASTAPLASTISPRLACRV